ncbi:type III secretion system translocon subunit SctB [uncultured Bilophila sp.]|uniref:type III secretion system translocon subunit SctB n=1 Tax=uncultured Bilophila sp. TaxID=529385 RepID=UPI00280C1604|nr:type III secretion system translocon subunit SctB [uncultured Bilophila sp.]
MSGIQGLSSDQQQVYNQLISDAGTVSVSKAAVDKELQVAMDAGLSFQEAAAQIRNDLPTLPPPSGHSGSLGGWVGVASPMASINALITEMSAEQRKENREVMKAQTDSIALSMEQQADEIRKKAVAQLVCGVVSGAINIGMGAVQFGMGMKQLNMGKQQGALAKEQGVLGKQQTDIANKQADLKALRNEGAKGLSGDELKQVNMEYSSRKASLKADMTDVKTQMKTLDVKSGALGAQSQSYGVMGQSMSQLGQGVSGIVGSIGQFVGAQYDAAMKEMEADQERMRASRDALKSINDSLSELIQKSISTQDAIQQNMNQTRSRILG